MRPVKDGVGSLVLPNSNGFQKLFSSKVMSRFAFRFIQPFLYYTLRWNACMVKAWGKKRCFSQHSVPGFHNPHELKHSVSKGNDWPPNQAILDRSSQSMANMQASSDIGRRCRNHKSFFFRTTLLLKEPARNFGFKKPLSLPPLVPSWLNCNRIIACCHRLRKVYETYVSKRNHERDSNRRHDA